MTAFLAICMVLFGIFVLIDLDDLRKRVNRADWIFLVFNTGMAVFAANALWGSF